MPNQYNSRYKLQIIQLFNRGYTNKQIWERLSCNIKTPQIYRKWWNGLTDEERAEWLEKANARFPEPKEEQQEQPKSVFKTPTSYAKSSRYIIH